MERAERLEWLAAWRPRQLRWLRWSETCSPPFLPLPPPSPSWSTSFLESFPWASPPLAPRSPPLVSSSPSPARPLSAADNTPPSPSPIPCARLILSTRPRRCSRPCAALTGCDKSTAAAASANPLFSLPPEAAATAAAPMNPISLRSPCRSNRAWVIASNGSARTSTLVATTETKKHGGNRNKHADD